MKLLMIVLQFESKNCFVLARIIKKKTTNHKKKKTKTKRKQENSKRNK